MAELFESPRERHRVIVKIVQVVLLFVLRYLYSAIRELGFRPISLFIGSANAEKLGPVPEILAAATIGWCIGHYSFVQEVTIHSKPFTPDVGCALGGCFLVAFLAFWIAVFESE
jgi:hypothetical protein